MKKNGFVCRKKNGMEEKNLASAIFEVENDTHLLDYKTYDGVPIWMISRWYLLQDIIGGKLLDYESPERMRSVNTKMINYIFKTAKYNFSHKEMFNAKSIFLLATNRKTLINNKYYNRYVDHFYEEYPEQSLVIEQAPLDWEWPFPRVNADVYFDAIGRVEGEIRSRFYYKKDYVKVCEMLMLFCKRVKLLFDIRIQNKEFEYIAIYISKLIVSMRYQSIWLNKKLTKDTKVVIAVGSGFPHYYFTNRMLRRRGIISVELQHGYITKNNIMYNYADVLVNKAQVKAGIPDFILTYGEWWNSQMNCPIKKVSIGNPYHEYCIKKISQVSKKNRNILIIGVGENTRDYISLAAFLRKNIKDYHTKFRPHPGEMIKAIKIINEGGYSIELDKNIDIYTTLANTSIIIGEVSTVLFEAIGIVNRIIVSNTKYTHTYLPEHPFETFNTGEDLVKKINNPYNCKYFENEMLWAECWKENYRKFIDSII